MSNPWFRFYNEFIHDYKVQSLSEADQRRFIMLLCLRCASDKRDDLRDAAVTYALRVTPEEWSVTKNTLIEKGLIDENNFPANWNKRQYISDIRGNTAAARAKRYRDRKRDERDASRVTAVTSRLPDTDTDTDTENSLVILPSPSEDGESETKVSRKKNNEAETALLQCVGEGWNDLADSLRLPQIGKLTAKRKSCVIARAKELVADYDYENPIDGFSALFDKIKSSKFLRGEANGFRCSFDFAFTQSSFTKIMEGAYENR